MWVCPAVKSSMAAIALRFFVCLLWEQQLQQLDLLSCCDSLHFPRGSAGSVEWGRVCNLNIPTQLYKENRGNIVFHWCAHLITDSILSKSRNYDAVTFLSLTPTHGEKEREWEKSEVRASRWILIWVWALVLSWWAQEVLDNMSSVNVVLTTVEIRTGLTPNSQWERLPQALNTQQTWWRSGQYCGDHSFEFVCVVLWKGT